MKITRIHFWQLDLPLHKPFWLSGSRTECPIDSGFILSRQLVRQEMKRSPIGPATVQLVLVSGSIP
jgi:hypothetical protein